MDDDDAFEWALRSSWGVHPLPPPEEIAMHLPARCVEAIIGARQGSDGFRVGKTHREELFRRGLVAARSHYLTACGHEVRRILKKDE